MSGAIPLFAELENATLKVVVGVIVAVVWLAAQVAGSLAKKQPKRPVPPGRTSPPARPPRVTQRTAPPRVNRPAPKPAALRPTPPVVRTVQARPSAVPPTAKPLPRQQMVSVLLRPRNLKKAFVLTEVLGTPVSLREDNARH